MKKSLKEKFQVEVVSFAGKAVCYPYLSAQDVFRTDTAKWNFVLIAKNMYLPVAVFPKLKRICVGNEVVQI